MPSHSTNHSDCISLSGNTLWLKNEPVGNRTNIIGASRASNSGHFTQLPRSKIARSQLSRAQHVGQFREIGSNEIMLWIWLWIGRPCRSPFVRPSHERCLVAAGLGSIKIEVMASHHATFAGIKLQKLGARLVGLRQDFVFADCFARNYSIPGNPISSRRIHHDAKAQQRERNT